MKYELLFLLNWFSYHNSKTIHILKQIYDKFMN